MVPAEKAMDGGARAVDLLVLQDCIRRLKQVPTPFGEAMDVARILVNLRRTSTALGEQDRALLGDVLALAVERAETAKQLGLTEPEPEPEPRASTPPRVGTPPRRRVAASPAVESPTQPPNSSQRGVDEVRVASWNMKHLSDSTALAEHAKKDIDKIVDVLRRFDFVAIQEVTNAQTTLQTLCAKLPGRWAFVVSPKFKQLNGRKCPECTAFLWRTERVQFTGPTDKDGAPSGFLVTESDTRTPAVHYWHRPPFFSSFRAGQLDFVAITCHVTFSGAPDTAQRAAFERTQDDEGEAGAPPVASRRQQPRRGKPLDKLDGRRLEVENLAAASILIREQLAASVRGKGKNAMPTLLVLADFNLDSDDPAFELMDRAGLRPLVDAQGSTMVKSDHAYDNIFASDPTPVGNATASKRVVGSKLRSGAVDLATVISDDTYSSDMAAALLREKSARSAAYDLLSDHKPVFVDLCCDSSQESARRGVVNGSSTLSQQVPAWRLAPIRMSRVGDIGRTYIGTS